MFIITIKGKFASAHALRGYKGKCENMHGHTFQVEVKLEGNKQNEIGIMSDFTDLKQHLDAVLDTLDHKDLNSLEYFSNINPSSENLAVYIFNNLKPLVDDEYANLVSVEVWESERQGVEYRP